MDDCFYWAKDNRCEADEVEVRNDFEVPNMEVGEMAGDLENDRARASPKTCCKTYRPGGQKRR